MLQFSEQAAADGMCLVLAGVLDTETGLYYLQSRYYDPEVGRFINADSFASTGQGLLGNNMFGGNLGKVTGSVAYSENCIAYSLGVTVGGTATIIPSLGGVPKTHYVQLFEVTIGSQQPSRHSNYNKYTGGQNSQ